MRGWSTNEVSTTIRQSSARLSDTCGGDLAGGLDAVDLGHRQVHEDHVGGQVGGQGDGLGAVGRGPDHLDVVGVSSSWVRPCRTMAWSSTISTRIT